MTTKRAMEDFRDKIMLERNLMIDINRINKQIVRATTKEFGLSSNILNAEQFRVPIADMLQKNYDDTAEVFGKKTSKILPSDIEETDEEREEIDSALTLAFLARSADQAQLITNTNQKDINESILSAQQMSQETAMETGKPVSQLDIAVLSGAILGRKLFNRSNTIAMTGIQWSSETSKGTEVEVLSGQDPSVLVGSNRESFVDKEWVTFGDEKVRQAHMIADGQVTDLNSPFIVDQQALRWPGDSSLGASAGNVINCRCASVYDEQTVFAVRRQSSELLISIQESL